MRIQPTIILGKHDDQAAFPFRKLLRSSTILISLAFATLYLSALQYCRHAFRRDPTSWFFDPTVGYKRGYSLQREEQARELIKDPPAYLVDSLSNTPPTMCIGVATRVRPDEQYVLSTIGSLLEGLSEAERRSIFLITLIAHTNPEDHPTYREEWVTSLSNRVLTYDVSDAELQQLRYFEETQQFRNKSIYDYGYLLDNCARTGARWVAMIEDDTLAIRTWYPRALKALASIEDMTYGDDKKDWLYLRMFFTETLFGWNDEEWLQYLLWSFAIFSIVIASLVGARAISKPVQRNLSNTAVALISCIYLPACIVLYFLAGRVSMQPLPPGVHSMPRFGCCSQGFIFSQDMVPQVVSRTRNEGAIEDVYVDMMMERWADNANLMRWVLVPSLLQHIGSKSSKGYGYDEGAESNWNFGFETFDPD